MAMEKDDQGLFEVGESKTTFASNFSSQRVVNIVRWILVILPTVISVLALLAMIIAIVIFSSTYNAMIIEQRASVDAKLADLGLLNATLQRKITDLGLLNATLQRKITDLGLLNATLQRKLTELDAAISNIQNAQSQKTYTRWGNSSCPDGSSLVYSGLTGGTSYPRQGGATNQLCLPMDPEYTLPTEAGVRASSLLYGSEYESIFLGTQNENVPCAVCMVTPRTEVIMIPAKINCPTSWTREYHGYLMSESNYRTTFICVDVGMESVPNSSGHAEACDLWHVEATCVSLPCPPYDEEKELGCVVCSK